MQPPRPEVARREIGGPGYAKIAALGEGFGEHAAGVSR
jgi:hypothetical protein